MNDNLDTLSDRELNLIFEREVVGLEPLKLAMASRDNGESGALFESNPYHHEIPITRESIDKFCHEYPQYKVCDRLATREHYCTMAAAVIPWLEKCDEVSCVCENGKWFVGIERNPTSHSSFVSATTPTFARAAAIALIRAKRSAP